MNIQKQDFFTLSHLPKAFQSLKKHYSLRVMLFFSELFNLVKRRSQGVILRCSTGGLQKFGSFLSSNPQYIPRMEVRLLVFRLYIKLYPQDRIRDRIKFCIWTLD